MKSLLALLIFFFSFAAYGGTAVTALAPGESLKFRVRWGILIAGEITMSARQENIAGLPQVRVATRTNTKGLVRGLYLFDGDGECIFDGRDGRLLAISASTSTSNKATKTTAFFDYQENKVQYVDYLRPERNTMMPMPEGNPMDLITCLIETRRWDMKPGDRTPATVMFDKEFYDIVIVAEGYENVHTPLGDFKSLVLVPTMDVNPKGMFKRGGRVRVWISQDEKHLPVKFEVAMKIGTGTALLTDYKPPKVATAEVADAHLSP